MKGACLTRTRTTSRAAKRTRFRNRPVPVPHGQQTNATQVYRSATEVSVTAYEPKRSETLRVVLPVRGARGVSAWIQWEVEMATSRRKLELRRRLGEVQRVRDRLRPSYGLLRFLGYVSRVVLVFKIHHTRKWSNGGNVLGRTEDESQTV